MARAKFYVQSKTQTASSCYDSKLQKIVEQILTSIKLYPVTSGSEENKGFYASTPSGSIEVGVLRSDVADQFEIKKEYYVDFTPAN